MLRSLLLSASLLAFTLAAHADLAPANYNVSINGANSGSLGFANSFASINGVGVVPFSVSLAPTTATFTFGTQVYGPVVPSLVVNNVLFIGNRVSDSISALTLAPSSTITGIVASTYINTIGGNPYTYINFDFTRSQYTAGSKATFNLSFPLAQTPEPSSFLLLATGLGAAFGALRRRPNRTAARI